jgi:membrane-associated phospholipid phosphatase
LPENSGVYHLADLYELRSTGHFVIDPFRLQGVVTFPSFHVAMAAMTVAAWRDDRRLRWWMLYFNLVVILSTVPIGGHYLIDLPAGLLCWAVIFYAGPVGTFLRQRWADYTDARDELWEGATSLAGN